MKTCNKENCNNPRFGGGFCRWHQGYRTDKWVGKNALSSKGGTKGTNKKKTRLKPISDKQAERLKEYRIVRDEYLKENPTCARCGTTNNLSLHHMIDRVGKNLTDKNNFMTLCIPCHRFVTDESEYAIKNGYSKSRLSKVKD